MAHNLAVLIVARIWLALKRWSRLMYKAGEHWVDEEAFRLGASFSFYALFSLFPLLLVIMSLAELILGNNEILRARLLAAVSVKASPEVRTLIERTLEGFMSHSVASDLSAVFGVIGLLLGATGMFAEFDTAIVRIWGGPPKTAEGGHSLVVFAKQLVHDRLVAFGLVTLMGVCFFVATILSTILTVIEKALPQSFQFIINNPLMHTLPSTLLAVLSITIIFRVLPPRFVQLRHAFYGAAIATLTLASARPAYDFAVAHLVNYSAYGIVGAVLTLILWIYICALVVLFGASFSYVCSSGASPTHSNPLPHANAKPA